MYKNFSGLWVPEKQDVENFTEPSNTERCNITLDSVSQDLRLLCTRMLRNIDSQLNELRTDMPYRDDEKEDSVIAIIKQLEREKERLEIIRKSTE